MLQLYHFRKASEYNHQRLQINQVHNEIELFLNDPFILIIKNADSYIKANSTIKINNQKPLLPYEMIAKLKKDIHNFKGQKQSLYMKG